MYVEGFLLGIVSGSVRDLLRFGLELFRGPFGRLVLDRFGILSGCVQAWIGVGLCSVRGQLVIGLDSVRTVVGIGL